MQGPPNITVRVALALRDAMVLPEFRDLVFEQAGKSGVSVNEVVITAAAKHFRAAGYRLPGVFRAGDLTEVHNGR